MHETTCRKTLVALTLVFGTTWGAPAGAQDWPLWAPALPSASSGLIPPRPFAGLAATPPGGIISPITGQNAPVVVCFVEGTDPAYMEAVNHLVNLINAPFAGTDYFLTGRWSGTQGTPRALTWSFVPDGLSISGGAGEPTSPSNLFATLDSAFASQGGRSVWISRFQQAFDRWQALAGLSYTRIRYNNQDWDDGATWGTGGSPGLRGDIRIAMHPIDGNGGVLAYNYFPSSGDMVLDSGDASNYASTSNQNRFLRNTVAHEHGHGIGLLHVCPTNGTKLMEPALNTSFDGPRQDDIRGAQRHYGDPFESNETAATATPLGTLNPSGTLTIGTIPNPPTGSNDPNAALCSIDAAGRVDWYSFTVGSDLSANITVTPVGSTYSNWQQSQTGACPSSGSSVNALAIADLVVDVWADNGTTLLAQANGTGAGSSETISNLSLSPGTYHVRVSAAGSPSESQLYRLMLTGTCAMPTVTQHPQSTTIEAGQTLSLTVAASNATNYQWRRNGINLINDGRITGTTTANLVIAPAVLADAGQYDVLVSNACGSAISNPAIVTITCYANCDGSTTPPILNVADFTCFLQRFAAGDLYANCDGSTTPPVLNVADFTCFLQRFAAGCP